LTFYCNFYPQILINTNKKSSLFFQQAAFLKILNKFITANYRRLPVLFRRPPPTKQIPSVNLHYCTILPHLPLFVNTKSQIKYFHLFTSLEILQKKKFSNRLTKSSILPNILWQWFFDQILLPGRFVFVKVYACIPARYGSTRFPAKVLAKDTGKFLIQHTYERACLAELPQKVIIATDDKKVVAAAKSFGAECIMTSPDCPSGTDRIAEAVADIDVDIVVNLQADEPEIDPKNIDYVAQLLIDNPGYPMATLAADFQNAQQIADPNIVKVITDCNNKAIYFSRSVIPYDRDKSGIGKLGHYLRHLGIYAYRKDFLLKITKLPQTPLEKIEKLEQLRALENGFSILVAKVKHTCDGIDTPDQYADFVRRYKKATERLKTKKENL
jgi:3-deoxy-manno-octulosonate cytidylyltransferase (CMP-KDO synthetase)